ncbi:MAG: organic solvent tolerance protein [Bdellovibrionaceae bacterium]|jgi:hypothetical protein|nr:organic solvent tolerance protein [Pseudobdellovibrionaceae bacterium]
MFLRGAVVCLLICMGFQVHSKDLTSRLGVGFSDNLSETLPSLYVKYYSSMETAFSASLGVDTKKDQSKFGFLAKVYRTIFMEDNLNFYMGAGAGLLSQEEAGTNSSGFELNGFAGVEFFLPGLDSLGFSVEMGMGVSSPASGTRFRTIGQTAGVVFYF